MGACADTKQALTGWRIELDGEADGLAGRSCLEFGLERLKFDVEKRPRDEAHAFTLSEAGMVRLRF